MMPLGDAEKAIISQRIWPLLDKREWPKTICPSEVARALSAQELLQLDTESWREAMARIREYVWELRGTGEVEVLQKGEVLDATVRLEDLHGPIRVRRTRPEK
jgi:hypothetical protein